MATIASLAVKITADDNPFRMTMQRVAERITMIGSMAKSMTVGTAGTAAGIGGQLLDGNAVGAAKSGIQAVSGALSSLAGSIPGIGPALSMAFETAGKAATTYIGLVQTAIGLFKQGAAPIKELYTNALRLNTTTETLAGIMATFGAADEQAMKGIFKMNRTLGEAATGSKEAERAFARIGLSWKDLIGLPLDQRLGRVNDALKAVANESIRSARETDIFGKAAIAMGPGIEKGSAGLVAGAERAKRFAMAISMPDAEQVMRASAALKQIDKAVTGVKMNIAVALAPVISGVAKEFDTLGVSAESVRDITIEGAKAMAYSIAAVVQVVDGIKAAWDMASIGVQAATAFTLDSMATTLEMAGKVPGVMSGRFADAAKDIRGRSRGMWDAAEKGRQEFLDRMAGPSAIEKTRRFFEGIEAATKQAKTGGGKDALAAAQAERMAEMARKVGDFQDKLDDQMAAYGRNSAAAEANKLAREGATEAMLQGVRATIAEIETLDRLTGTATQTSNIFQDFAAKQAALQAAFEAGKISADGLAGGMSKISEALDKSMAAKAAEVFNSTRTPMEQMQAKVEELGGLLERGAISWDTYSRAVGTAANQLEGAAGVNAQPKFAGAATAGGQEAYRAIFEASTAASTSNDPMAKLQDAMKRQEELQKKIAKDNATIAKAARDGFLRMGKI